MHHLISNFVSVIGAFVSSLYDHTGQDISSCATPECNAPEQALPVEVLMLFSDYECTRLFSASERPVWPVDDSMKKFPNLMSPV